MPEQELYLRMPGRIYERLNEMAIERMDLIEKAEQWGTDEMVAFAKEDEPVCDALSRPRVKNRGGGYTFFVPIGLDELERLSSWITDAEKAELRRFREMVREAAKAKRLEQARAS